MASLLSTPIEARKAIRQHKGICLVGMAGPLEWQVIITKAEATEVIKQAEINDCDIQITIQDDNLRIALWEK